MNNLKLAVITELPAEHFPFWGDGLRGAIDYIAAKHGAEVSIYNIPSMKQPSIPDTYDFYLFWGAFNRPQHAFKRFKKQGLIFGGGPTEHPYNKNFDIVFAESKVDLESFQKQGIPSVQAFGTNTKMFKPCPWQPKRFNYIYPAAFALWKRHDRFVEFLDRCSPGEHPSMGPWCTKHNSPIEQGNCMKLNKPSALAIGYIQPNGHERECYIVCANAGVSILPWVPTEAMVLIYNSAKNVVVTADPDGGCQRTVLEAKACDIPVIVDSESPKLKELDPLTHEDVLRDWNEETYGEKIYKKIMEVL